MSVEAPVPGSWEDRTEGRFFYVGVVLVALITLASAPNVALHLVAHGAASWWPALLAGGCLILGVFELRAHSAKLFALTACLAALVLVSAAIWSPPLPLPTHWWLLHFATAYASYAVSRRGHSVIPGLVGCSVFLAGFALDYILIASMEGSAVHLALRFFQLTVVVASVGGAAWTLRVAARDADRARAARDDAAERVELSRNRVDRAQEARRFIHDEVMSTLRVVSLAGDGVRADDAQRYVDSLDELLERERLSQRLHRVDLLEVLTDVDVPGLEVSLRAPTSCYVPAAVAIAIAGATKEALRNCLRHSGQTSAKVLVRALPLGVEVIIQDHGTGFSPESTRASAHGIRESILQRMNDVEGAGSVTSDRSGTVVTLRWEAPSPSVSGRRFAWSAATLPRTLRNISLINIAFVLPLPIATWLTVGSLDRPELVFSATAILLVLTLLVPVLALRRGLPGWAAVVLIALSCVVEVVGEIAVAPGIVDTNSNEIAGPASALVILVVIFRRPWEGAMGGLLATAATALGSWLNFQAWPLVYERWTVITSPLIAVLAALAFRVQAERVGAAELVADAERRDLARAGAGFEQTIADTTRELDQIDVAVRAFVKSLARGDLDIRDPRVAQAADMLEQALRDDLNLARLPLTLQAIREARRHGWRIDALVETDSYHEVDEATALAIARAVAACHDAGGGAASLRLTVRTGSSRCTASILLRGINAACDPIEWEVNRDEQSARWQMVWTRDDRAPLHPLSVKRSAQAS